MGPPGAGKVLAGHTAQVYAVAWTPDGKQLFTGAADRSVRRMGHGQRYPGQAMEDQLRTWSMPWR